MAFDNVDGYLSHLQEEKDNIQNEFVHAKKLLEREIAKRESGETLSPVVLKDIHKNEPIHLQAKVIVPVRDHPNFNFVGKLLGPKGNSLKRLQQATQTKMAVLGRGSMRDKAKEEELRKGGDPKYTHLNEDLHVEIIAFASPHEAYSRMAKALKELRKFLIPDYYDDIRQNQLLELALLNGEEPVLDDCHSDDKVDGIKNTVTTSSSSRLFPPTVPVKNRTICRNVPTVNYPVIQEKTNFIPNQYSDPIYDHVCEGESCTFRNINYYDCYSMSSEDFYNIDSYVDEMQQCTSARGKLPRSLPRTFRRDHPYLPTYR